MHFPVKVFTIVFFTIICSADIAIARRKCKKDCVSTFRCNPYYTEPVWAIVKGLCKVFPNGCIFAEENQRRECKCLKAFKEVEQKECQQKCKSCKKKYHYKPVCASFAKGDSGLADQITFDNQRIADQFACQNAKPYFAISPGVCPAVKG